ncbi:hypothetical protein Rsub_08155 [Raphidocelis subcapitata]|uniref:Amine oxidase domain-containing protein n=1 Tax=Raphidocelis subcapitata TaxID=307507 RepID=A0A2V0P7L4_9CHLO|nr:hypothetical protein Rsub_08155 [Raphidocelis subcapitata]|eukprot:GBF94912.1 hypothetical protein Rsub_08155 [Raphidocelis subcapitata]
MKTGGGDPGAMEKVSILVLGAGPTGLGAATRLQQHGHEDWLLLDQAPGPGGLSCTDVTPEGFYFDMGGHVTFSHWKYFDDLLDTALGTGEEAWNVHQRVSYVRLKGRWVAYPFQNNIAALDKDDQVACLSGLVEARLADAAAKEPPATFDEWIMRCMGRGIADLFMRPYNFKVWAVPTTLMQCGWLGERVATVDLPRAIANVVHGREDAGWGPNAVFRFPKRGGTGAVWRAVAALLPDERQRYNARVVSIDADARVARLAGGRAVRYGKLLTTLPLDATLTWLGRGEWAEGLRRSSSHIIGVGLRGACPHGSKCWLYFPEPDCPFYRATVFSNYAAANCPPPGARLRTLCLGDGRPPGAAVAAAPAPAPARRRGGGRRQGAAAVESSAGGAEEAVAPAAEEAAAEEGGRSSLSPEAEASAAEADAAAAAADAEPETFEAAAGSGAAASAAAGSAAAGPEADTAAAGSAAAGRGEAEEEAAGGAGPEGGPYWSLMFEVSESDLKPVAQDPVPLAGGTWPRVVADTLAGAVAAGLVSADAEVVSIYHRRLEHGYPTPSLGRDAALQRALPWLKERGIWSRGRFGSYKYEVGNQDHSLMLGVEAVDNMLFGTPELTLHHPSIVNARRSEEPRYAPPGAAAGAAPAAAEPRRRRGGKEAEGEGEEAGEEEGKRRRTEGGEEAEAERQPRKAEGQGET